MSSWKASKQIFALSQLKFYEYQIHPKNIKINTLKKLTQKLPLTSKHNCISHKNPSNSLVYSIIFFQSFPFGASTRHSKRRYASTYLPQSRSRPRTWPTKPPQHDQTETPGRLAYRNWNPLKFNGIWRCVLYAARFLTRSCPHPPFSRLNNST